MLIDIYNATEAELLTLPVKVLQAEASRLGVSLTSRTKAVIVKSLLAFREGLEERSAYDGAISNPHTKEVYAVVLEVARAEFCQVVEAYLDSSEDRELADAEWVNNIAKLARMLEGEAVLRRDTPQSRSGFRTHVLAHLQACLEKEAGTPHENVRIATLDKLRREWLGYGKVDTTVKKRETATNLMGRSIGRSRVWVGTALEEARKYAETLPDSVPARHSKTKTHSAPLTLIYLALVTGRRIYSEILCTGDIEIASPDTVIFRGQAKTKGSNTLASDGFEIPVLIPSDLTLKLWRSLDPVRQDLRDALDAENSTVVEFNAKVEKQMSSGFGRFVRKWAHRTLVVEALGAKEPTITPHKLRAIYALTSCETRPANFAPNAWIARILGHGENDLGTANSYLADFDVVLGKPEHGKPSVR